MAIEERELTEKDKQVLKQMQEMVERLSNNHNSKRKRVFIKDLPRKYKLNEEEKQQIPGKYRTYLAIQEDAIAIVKKHINNIKNGSNEELKSILPDLENGLNVLETGLQRDKDEGMEGMIANLERFQKGRRPGFGLSRGFGEFLWQGDDWQKEIMDAIDKIENYYYSM